MICFSNFVSLCKESGDVDSGDGNCLHLKAVCQIIVSCLDFVCMLTLLH